MTKEVVHQMKHDATMSRELARLRGVEDACVGTIRDHFGVDVVVAWVVSASTCEPTCLDVRAHLREAGCISGLPTVVVPLKRLPRTDQGAVDLEELPKPVRTASPLGDVRYVVDGDEEFVREAWYQLLGTVPDVDDNFFEIGGTSLQLLRFLGICEKELGIDLSVSDVTSEPTPIGIAALLRQGATTRRGITILHFNKGGERLPVLVFYPGIGIRSARALQELDGDRPVLYAAPHWPSNASPSFPSVSDIAERHVAELFGSLSGRPVHVVGSCASTAIAAEFARQFDKGGEQIASLSLIHPSPIVGSGWAPPTSLFLFDDLFVGQASASYVEPLRVLLQSVSSSPRTSDDAAALLERMDVPLRETHRGLMSTGAISCEIRFDDFRSLVHSWLKYVLAVVRFDPSVLKPVAPTISMAPDSSLGWWDEFTSLRLGSAVAEPMEDPVSLKVILTHMATSESSLRDPRPDVRQDVHRP